MARTRREALAFISAGASALGVPVRAGPSLASPWSRAMKSGIRLLAGEYRGEGVDHHLLAGLEMSLAPGYHTYWREPGDSGVPPTFDWSASRNLAAVEVIWPAPRRFDDASGHYIGYAQGLLLPLRLKPRDAAAPLALGLKLAYAVCEKICIPAEGALRLTIEPGRFSSRYLAPLLEALTRAPHRVRPGEMRAGMALSSVEPDQTGGPGVIIKAILPSAARDIDVFIEGGAGTVFGKPVLVSRDATAGESPIISLRVPAARLPKGKIRQTLLLTLICDRGAIESEVTIDLSS
jgi:suppressor for copper-sensitivity B